MDDRQRQKNKQRMYSILSQQMMPELNEGHSSHIDEKERRQKPKRANNVAIGQKQHIGIALA